MKQEISAQRMVWLPQQRAAIEGRLPLPQGLGDLQTLLDSQGTGEVTGCRVEEGRLTLTGLLRFTVLYIDKEGNPCSFESETDFTHTVEDPRLLPQMEWGALLSVGETSLRIQDPRGAWLRAEALVTLLTACNETCHILSADLPLEGAEVRLAPFALPRTVCLKCVRTYATGEISIPQNLPKVGDILLTRGFLTLSPSTPEEGGRLPVEGELHLSLAYLSPDKNGPLHYLRETIPFRETLTGLPELTEGEVCLFPAVERLTAQVSGADPDLVEVTAVVSLCLYACQMTRGELVADLYSRNMEAEPDFLSLEGCRPGGESCLHRTLRGDFTLPDTLPEAVRILHARGEVVSSGEAPALALHLCFTTESAGTKSARILLPPDPGLAEEGIVTPYVEWVEVSGSGRDFSYKASLLICTREEESYAIRAARDVIPGEPCAPRSGLILWFADGRDTLWDIAKKLKVRRDCIQWEGDENTPVPKGTRLVLLQ